MGKTKLAKTPERPVNALIGKNSLMLFLLCLTYALSYFDRMLMVVLGELVKQEFALSDKQLSLLTGASFAIMYGACAIAAGWLVDRYNRKRILAWSLSLWSVATMACGMAGSFVQLAAARAAVGVGEAANVPVAMSMISDIYKAAKRPMATALFFSGGMASVLASFAFGSWVAEHYGWRMAFLWAGPPGFILALLIIFFTREPDREAAPASSDDGSTPTNQNGFRLILNNPALVWLLLAGGIGGFTSVGMIQWLPIFFIRSHGLSQADIGTLFGPVMAVAMTGGMLAGGWIGNRIAAKSVQGLIQLCIGAMLLIAPLYLSALWVSSVALSLVFTFLGTALSVAYSPCFSAAWQTICDPRARGIAGGITAFGSILLGGALCTFIIGALSDYWSSTMGSESLRYAVSVGTAVFCVLTAIFFFISMKLQTRSSLRVRQHNSPRVDP
ncbi:MAG: MFS transporter [Porticoccaceae bacterium]